jgi:AcrR family transcriptional regulator
MPRPRTISDEAILDAVLALAHRVGPARVTFAAAGAEVGLSAATLVQRFGPGLDVSAILREVERRTEGEQRH